MLAVALAKARKLVAELEREAAELKAKPPDLPPDRLAMGEMAMSNAVASAKRMLKALEDAAEVAGDDLEGS
jgi:hypothetical protein